MKIKSDIKFKNKDNPSFCDVFKDSILTEKTSKLELGMNCLTFIVPKWATKPMIKAAVTHILNSEVINVRIINTFGKRKVLKGRFFRLPTVKKAMVRVKTLANMVGY